MFVHGDLFGYVAQNGRTISTVVPVVSIDPALPVIFIVKSSILTPERKGEVNMHQFRLLPNQWTSFNLGVFPRGGDIRWTVVGCRMRSIRLVTPPPVRPVASNRTVPLVITGGQTSAMGVCHFCGYPLRPGESGFHAEHMPRGMLNGYNHQSRGISLTGLPTCGGLKQDNSPCGTQLYTAEDFSTGLCQYHRHHKY